MKTVVTVNVDKIKRNKKMAALSLEEVLSRCKEEYMELSKKVEYQRNFIHSMNFQEMEKIAQDLMIKQFGYMTGYQNTLKSRIDYMTAQCKSM